MSSPVMFSGYAMGRFCDGLKSPKRSKLLDMPRKFQKQQGLTTVKK
jgi:hypothetical protein